MTHANPNGLGITWVVQSCTLRNMSHALDDPLAANKACDKYLQKYPVTRTQLENLGGIVPIAVQQSATQYRGQIWADLRNGAK
jgi:hypothetical protein